VALSGYCVALACLGTGQDAQILCDCMTAALSPADEDQRRRIVNRANAA
jgi:hypothetical protein